MAEIPRRLWDRYTTQLQRQAATASAFVTRSVSAYMASHPRASVADVREAARRALEQAVKAYGLLAAELAALMYDECLRAAGAEGVEPASPDGGSGIAEEADKIARYQAKKLVKGDRGGFIAQLGKSAADRVLARANATVVAAASRPADRMAGVRWARVLTGMENCTFCTMLASRGFVYGSESKASAGRHRNCDCRVVPGLPDTSVEGYDLDAVAEQWAEYEDIDSRTHEDGTPWTSAEKRAAKAEWAKEHPVWRKAGSRQSGAVSGALNDSNDPNFELRNAHAKRYYKEVVNRDREQTLSRIASASGLSQDVVEVGFSHLFLEKHDLMKGRTYFAPDYEIAQSVQRLLDGRPEKHDLLLFAHEELESRYMAEGMSYAAAHNKANETYNYADAVGRWLDGRE